MPTYPLGDLKLEDFLSHYWQKKPLFIENALPDIQSPLSADELAGLSCESDIESRLIINTGNDWQLQHGPLDEDTFTHLPTSHWTLLVQAVNHYSPQAAQLLELFNFIPRWRIDDLMVSYACKGGGVGAHYDNYDVFLVQTQGQRQWQVGGHYNDTSPVKENLPVKIIKHFQPEYSWLLNPGDILYIPPGVGHNGIAQSDDCMTSSVGFRAPSYNDILREYTDYLGEQLNESLRYSDADIKPQTNSGEISQDALLKLEAVISEQTSNKQKLTDWFGRYITTPKYESANYSDYNVSDATLSMHALQNQLAAGVTLSRELNSRFAFIKQTHQHILFVNGERIDTCPNTNAFVEQLCAEVTLSHQDFTHTDDNLTLILTLINQGALTLTHD